MEKKASALDAASFKLLIGVIQGMQFSVGVAKKMEATTPFRFLFCGVGVRIGDGSRFLYWSQFNLQVWYLCSLPTPPKLTPEP